MNIKALAIGIALATTVTASAEAADLWTNTSGKAIEAEFVSLRGDQVILRKVAREYTFSLSTLSKESQTKVKDLARGISENDLFNHDWFDGLYYHTLTKDGKVSSIRKTGNITYSSTFEIHNGKIVVENVSGSVQRILIGYVDSEKMDLVDSNPQEEYKISWEKVKQLSPRERKEEEREAAQEAAASFLSKS